MEFAAQALFQDTASDPVEAKQLQGLGCKLTSRVIMLGETVHVNGSDTRVPYGVMEHMV